jgi:hypothetical protein
VERYRLVTRRGLDGLACAVPKQLDEIESILNRTPAAEIGALSCSRGAVAASPARSHDQADA